MAYVVHPVYGNNETLFFCSILPAPSQRYDREDDDRSFRQQMQVTSCMSF